jgi:hypothetical protein
VATPLDPWPLDFDLCALNRPVVAGAVDIDEQILVGKHPDDFHILAAHLEAWRQPDIGRLRGGPVVMAFMGDDRRRQGKQRQQNGRHTSSGQVGMNDGRVTA